MNRSRSAVHQLPNLALHLLGLAIILCAVVDWLGDPTLSIRARKVRESLSCSVTGQISRHVRQKRRAIIELMELLARAIHVARNVDELLVKCQIAGLKGLDVSKLVYVDVLIAYFID